MVRYLDPEDHPELGEERRRRSSPGERLARARERNAALTGTAAIEAAREVALRKLDARACSRSELTSAIEGRGFSAEIAVEVLELGVEVLEAGDDLLPPFFEVVSDVAFGGALRPVPRCALHSVAGSALDAAVQRVFDIVVSQAVAGIAARCLIGHDLQHTHA